MKIRKFLPFTFLIIPATLRLIDNPGCNLQQWLESCMKHCSVFTLSVPLNIQTISAKFLVAQLRHPSELIPIIGKIGERKKSNYLTFSFAESIHQAVKQDLPDTPCQAVLSVASKCNIHCFAECLFCFLAVVKLTFGTHIGSFSTKFFKIFSVLQSRALILLKSICAKYLIYLF